MATASRRQYLTIAELEEYADISVSDTDEAFDQISQAEEIIDAYVGYQDRAVSQRRGEVTSATGTTLTDNDGGSQLYSVDDYFKGCEVEVVGGTGSGQRRTISTSIRDTKTITVDAAWTQTPDTTSVFRIYQLGKFPRLQDRWTNRAGTKWFGSIPEAVRRATAAQVQYMIEMGADYFAGADTDMDSESIGNYSYAHGGNSSQSALVKMIAPKARALLKGIKNSTGRLVAENPTCP